MPKKDFMLKDSHPWWMHPIVLFLIVFIVLILFRLFSPSWLTGPKEARGAEIASSALLIDSILPEPLAGHIGDIVHARAHTSRPLAKGEQIFWDVYGNNVLVIFEDTYVDGNDVDEPWPIGEHKAGEVLFRSSKDVSLVCARLWKDQAFEIAHYCKQAKTLP